MTERDLKIALAPIIAILIVITSIIIYTDFKSRTSDAGPPPPLNVTGSELYEPAVWGESYPDEYRTWLLTKNDKPPQKSVYKRGGAEGATYDKLSEYPYLALLYRGWGFGDEYNEPRGHYNMLEDQTAVEKSRLKTGGVCLSCKTPYSIELSNKKGAAFLTMPYNEAVDLITQRNGQIGATCVDCHNPQNMALKPLRPDVVQMIVSFGKTDLNSGDMRSLVCAQCHSSYIIPRDANMNASGLELPWRNGTWGNLSVESMIAQIEGNSAYFEWTQAVTGLRFGFIRHPEYEMYSMNSVHWAKSVACSSCHMETMTSDQGYRYFSHDVNSPLETDMRSCEGCHSDTTPAKLRSDVLAVQKQYVREMNTAGYAAAVTASLIERVNGLKTAGVAIDQIRFAAAIDAYRQAFYRVVFLAAENSVGFHNPKEASRLSRDAAMAASKSQALLTAILTDAGSPPPEVINLDLPKYFHSRGEKKLGFEPGVEYENEDAFPDIPLKPYIKGI